MAGYDIGVYPNSIPQCEPLSPIKHEIIVLRLTVSVINECLQVCLRTKVAMLSHRKLTQPSKSLKFVLLHVGSCNALLSLLY